MDVLTTQQEFDHKYISSTEIVDRLKISRAAVLHARKRGWLPNGIGINNGQLYIWERDKLKPYLDAWELQLNVRRGG